MCVELSGGKYVELQADGSPARGAVLITAVHLLWCAMWCYAFCQNPPSWF